MNDLLVALETEAARASRQGGTRRRLGLLLASACALLGAGSLVVARWPRTPEATPLAPAATTSAAPEIRTAAGSSAPSAAPSTVTPATVTPSTVAPSGSAAPRKTTHAAPRSSAPKAPPRNDELMEPGFARKK